MRKILAAAALVLVGGALSLAFSASAQAGTTDTYYVNIATVDVPAGTWADGIAYCNSGDVATGGGITLNNYGNPLVRISSPISVGSNTYPQGWYAEVYNGDSIDRQAFVKAVCVHLGS